MLFCDVKSHVFKEIASTKKYGSLEVSLNLPQGPLPNRGIVYLIGVNKEKRGLLFINRSFIEQIELSHTQKRSHVITQGLTHFWVKQIGPNLGRPA